MVIVSTGRTGTMSLARYFGQQYRDTVALHEPRGSRALRILGHLHAAGHISTRVALPLVRITFGRRLIKYSPQYYVESNPALCCLLPVIGRLHPDIRIVHVVRDPVDFARSYINHGAFRGVKGVLGSICPYWFLKPEHVRATALGRWRDLSLMQAAVWRWYSINSQIEHDAVSHGLPLLRVRFEDLFGDDGTTISHVAEWAGFADRRKQPGDCPDRVNCSTRDLAPRESGGSGTVEAIVEEICGSLPHRYGYGEGLSTSSSAGNAGRLGPC